jgi:tetratricopeptide (TPR) repeat protein
MEFMIRHDLRLKADFWILLLVTGFAFLSFNCSSVKEVTGKSEQEKSKISEINPNQKDETLEHFINGSVADIKEDYPTAILEYQDALRLDERPGIYYALAKDYLRLNKIPLAIQNSKKSIQMDSTQDEYYELLSDIFSEANQPDSAAAVLENLLKIDSTNVGSYYKLARIYENSKPLQAISIYNKLTRRIGPEWNVMIHLAEMNEKLGNFDDAIKNLKDLLTLDPANTSIQKLLAKYYGKQKKYDTALKILNGIIELTPDDLDARQLIAQIYIDQNDWDNASKEFSYIISKPDVPLQVKVGIGVSYFVQSLKDSSVLPLAKKFFETIDKDTLAWQVKMYLGAIALNEGRDSVANENFKKVIELESQNAQAWVQLGGLYYDNQKYSEAVKLMNEAVESYPDDFNVNLILGLSLEQTNKHEEAAKYLETAVNLNPSDVNALSAYAYTLNSLQEPKEAIEYLNKALVIDPKNVNILGTLGLIYNAQKKYAECDSVYREALRLDSTNALVNNNYAYSLSVRGINLNKALRMVQISVKAEPNNSAYLDTIGWVYFKLGDYDKAKDYIQKAIKKGGERSEILEHLGDVEFKLGEKESAQKLWQKAYSLDKSNAELKSKIEKGEI